MADAYVNDVGLALEVVLVDTAGVAINISTATTRQITIRKPDGTKVTQTAVFTTDGTDGKIRYLSVATDFTLPGTYSYQGRVIWSSGANDRRTAILSLIIGESL